MTNPSRDFGYARVIVGCRAFVHDRGGFGLRLYQSNGEVLDVVFDRQAIPDLKKLRTLLEDGIPFWEQK